MGLEIRANEKETWDTFTLERQLEVVENAEHLLLFRGDPYGKISLSEVLSVELIGF